MRYLVHIGYPKAASTWLQKKFFCGADSRIQGIKGAVNFKPGERFFLHPVEDALHGFNPFRCNDVPSIQSEIAKNSSPDVINVLSNEAWAGCPYSGGITGKLFADRIHATLPEAKILIIVRNQVDAIYSSYSDYLDRFGCITKLKVLLRLPSIVWSQVPGFSIQYFDYKWLIQYHDSLFGRENVIVVPFELIKQSPDKFVEPIYHAFDMEMDPALRFDASPANVRDYSTTALLSRLRFLNMMVGPRAGNSAFSFSAKRFRLGTLKFLRAVLPQKYIKSIIENDKALIRRSCVDVFRESNAWLSERTGYNLAELGWEL